MSTVDALNPSEIFADMKAQPPLMWPQAAKAYVGKAVDWSLIFANASEPSSGQAHLIFRVNPDEVRMVTGKVSLSAYPQLRSLHSGERVRLRGRIRKIDTLSVELEITELLFSPMTAATQ